MGRSVEPEFCRAVDGADELAEATIQAHRCRPKQFVDWCEADGIDNLNDITGRDIHRLRVHRRDKDDRVFVFAACRAWSEYRWHRLYVCQAAQ